MSNIHPHMRVNYHQAALGAFSMNQPPAKKQRIVKQQQYCSDNDDDDDDDFSDDAKVDEEMKAVLEQLAVEEEDGKFRRLNEVWNQKVVRYRMMKAHKTISCTNPKHCGCVSHSISCAGNVIAKTYGRCVADAHGCHVELQKDNIFPHIIDTLKPAMHTRRSEEYAWIPCTVEVRNRTLSLFWAGDILPITSTYSLQEATNSSVVIPTNSDTNNDIEIDLANTKKTNLELFIEQVSASNCGRQQQSLTCDSVQTKVPKYMKGQRTLGCTTATLEGFVTSVPKKMKRETTRVEKSGKKHKEFTRNVFYVDAADIVIVGKKT